jgi:hypothetical protein
VVTRSLWVREILGSIPGERRLCFWQICLEMEKRRVWCLHPAFIPSKALWESGLIRQLKALVLRGMGSSPIEVTFPSFLLLLQQPPLRTTGAIV